VIAPSRLIACAGIATATLLAGCASGSGSNGRPTTAQTAEQEALSLRSGVLRPPNVEPRIALTDTSGASYDVEKRGAGKVTLVYFGYTHCPDVCPTTMADIAQAMRSVPSAVRQRVAVVFVSVDPRRDSRAVIRDWLDGFDRSFIGLRGSLHSVIAAQRAAHLPVSKVLNNGKAIEHAAQVVVYTPDRLEHTVFVDGPSTITDLEHDLPILATGKGFGA
jgi:protein SCO1/2